MKYPVGLQDFREIRSNNYLYVDKTEQIFRLLEAGKYFFLSRPRRFGKSLLLSTLNELYCGSRELFEGLWIENQWNWTNTNPVVWIKFASIDYKQKGLYEALVDGIRQQARQLGIALNGETLKDNFFELIQKAGSPDRKTVLLIDEYDKPIIDYIDQPEQAEANRDILKQFYSLLKDCDPQLELVFITGVSAFSKVSIFSDLNNLDNLTLSPWAHTLLGLTHQELERFFPEQIARVNVEKLKEWYNGYCWGGDTRVYNPFSILRFFKDGQHYQNYWFETGTPTFLVKEMKRQQFFDIEHTAAASSSLLNFDLQRLQPLPVLFQTGYLTIERYVEDDLLYILRYPNREVKHSMQEILLNEYLDFPVEGATPRVVNLRNALRNKDIALTVEIINAAFAEIPAEHWAGQNEHFYHAVTHLMFSMLGTYIQSEVNSSKGRCDAVVQTADTIYAFEFKLDKSADEALRQVHERGYLAPYAHSGKTRIAVGINFSSQEKQVTDWKREIV